MGEVICQDALVFLKSLKEKPSLILTDIPYGEVNRKSGGLRNLDKGHADVVTFDLEELACSFVNNSGKNASIYVFCGTEQVSTLRRTFVSHKLSTRLCIWKKRAPSPMNCQYLWLSDVECCVYARKPKGTFNGKYLSSVWEELSSRNKFHPTEKPLSLMKKLIEVSSNKGDLVVDPFCGGGSTLVAAKELGRRYAGCDKNSDCVNITLGRLVNVN